MASRTKSDGDRCSFFLLLVRFGASAGRLDRVELICLHVIKVSTVSSTTDQAGEESIFPWFHDDSRLESPISPPTLRFSSMNIETRSVLGLALDRRKLVELLTSWRMEDRLGEL